MSVMTVIITHVFSEEKTQIYNNNNNNNNTFVERHSAVASEALAEQVSYYAVLNK